MNIKKKRPGIEDFGDDKIYLYIKNILGLLFQIHKAF